MPTTTQNQGPGCMAVFGSVFAIAGITALLAGLRGMARHEQNAFVGVLVGGIFIVVGLGIVITAVWGLKRARIDKELKAKFPDQPWKWKSQWASGEIPDNSAAAVLSLWAFTIIWNVIAFPIAIVAISDPSNHANNAVYFVLLFPLVGLLVLANAIYATVRRRKFGDSTFVPTAMPFSPGREMVGTILVPKEFPLGSEVNLRIVCVHRVETRNGKNDRVNETITWEDESTARPLTTRGVAGVQIPVRFSLPADATPTDNANSRDQRIWRLTAKASLPGADYSVKFELPVFANAAANASDSAQGSLADDNTPVATSADLTALDMPAASSDSAAAPSALASAFAADAASIGMSADIAPPIHPDEHVMTKPTESGIRATRRIDGGWDFHFNAGRNLGSSAMWALFFAIFAGAMGGMVYFAFFQASKRDWFDLMFIPFIVIGLLLLAVIVLIIGLALWQSLFEHSDISVSRGVLSAKSSSLIYRSRHKVQAADVREILPKMTGQTGDSTFYSIEITLKNMDRFNIASGISSKRDAQWLVDRMKQALGIS